ncbi:MAG: caspase family protein [Pseudomonadota bacterium]
MLCRLATLVLLLWAQPVLSATTFGLVIGIDEYAFIPDLHGAVNDAEDIADALEELGASVQLLRNGEATREAVLGAWEAVLDRAEPGDRLIVSYAGHGSNEPEHRAGSERDGRDENFLLAGFAPRGVSAGERIRDDEIADLLARRNDIDVIFIADACHAGTVTRNLNPTLGYRYVEAATMEADPLQPPPAPTGDHSSGTNVALFLAAVNETEKVPEILIDGVARGALSYAFADALRGAADLDEDGELTKGEIETHVRRKVRQLSDGAQLPQSEPVGNENRALLVIPSPAAPPPTLFARDFQALPPLGENALRVEDNRVYSAVGDRVAHLDRASDFARVKAKHRLVAALQTLALPPLAIRFDRGDRLYQAGETANVSVENRTTPHLTLFNLSADGTITLLYPLTGFGDPAAVPPGERVELRAEASPPFGADHVVAVESETPPIILRAQISAIDGTRDLERLWNALRAEPGRIAVFPLMTAERAL